MSRLGLRGRLTVLSVVGFALALAAVSAALYAVLVWTGEHTLVDAENATARQVAALVQQHRLSDPIPVTGAQIVQVVDARLRVDSASTNADRLTALLVPGELRRARAGVAVTVSGSRVGLDSPLRVVALPVADHTPERTVLVAQQFAEVTHSRQVLVRSLLVGYPLLVLVFGLIAWLITGLTLRPVAALRAGAERISGTGLDERLPVPGSRDEIRALAETLNSMLDRLAASRARQRAFVADAAHELRSPLTSLRTQIEVAQHLGEATALEDDLLAELVRLAVLVDGLLLLARADAASLPPPAPERLDAGSILDTLAARYQTARVPVTVSPWSPALSGTGDRQALSRALGNLVDNAVRHARHGVSLTARPAGGSVVLVVDDDGPGIPEADRERVFDRFTRLDEARDRDSGGSGLGLAIVRELVHAMGGTVRLADSPAGGLRAELRLPAPAAGSPGHHGEPTPTTVSSSG